MPENIERKYTDSSPIKLTKAVLSRLRGARRKNNIARTTPIVNNAPPRVFLVTATPHGAVNH